MLRLRYTMTGTLEVVKEWYPPNSTIKDIIATEREAILAGDLVVTELSDFNLDIVEDN
jgi:hypothetical protein